MKVCYSQLMSFKHQVATPCNLVNMESDCISVKDKKSSKFSNFSKLHTKQMLYFINVLKIEFIIILTRKNHWLSSCACKERLTEYSDMWSKHCTAYFTIYYPDPPNVAKFLSGSRSQHHSSHFFDPGGVANQRLIK